MIRHLARAALILVTFAGVAAGQRGAPLLKTDLIDLLSSPVIPNQEVADLVRRNCLAFRPTDRDWTDFRSLGASAAVVASIRGCATGRPAAVDPIAAAAAPVTAATMTVVLRQPRIRAAAGSQVRIAVLAALAGLPQAGVQLMLRGSAAIDGGSGHDVVAATDDSGFAFFPLRVGRRLNTYRLEVVPVSGGALPGRPVIELMVRPGPPTSAFVEPTQIVFDQGLDSIIPVAVAVRDSIGYPVAGEPVVLGGNAEAAGFRSDTATTDSLGRARLFVTWGGARQGGTLQVKVSGRQLAWVEVVVGEPLLEAATGFLPAETIRGEVGSPLGAPLVFEARGRLGHPAAGRAVSFRAVNAVVSPTTATTDAEGRVRVDVLLGDRVGAAMVVATIDSLERFVVLQAEPGPAVELALEQNGSRVDGRWLVVPNDTTFVLRLRALDARGHPTPVTSLARVLWASRAQLDAKLQILRLVSVQEEAQAAVLTFKSVGVGRTALKLSAADLSALVKVEVVPRR